MLESSLWRACAAGQVWMLERAWSQPAVWGRALLSATPAKGLG